VKVLPLILLLLQGCETVPTTHHEAWLLWQECGTPP
jgi:hypothetical protein